MVSSLTQSKLVNLLQTIARGEQDRESSRLSLAQNHSFESYTAFKRIDRYSDNSLSFGEIINFLKDNRIQVHETELRPFFEAYSCKGGVRLTYTDFQKIILPKTNGLLKHQCLGRKVQALASDEYLEDRIEYALANLIHNEIVFLQKLENLKEELSTRHDFSLLDAFKLVDEEDRGSLDFTLLYNFLEKNGRVTKSDVESLLSRFDKNRDQELSYSEFVQLLQPLNPNYRVSLRSCSPVKKSRPSSPRVASPRRTYVSEYSYTPVKSKREEDNNYRNYLRETARTEAESRREQSPSYTQGSFISPVRERSPKAASPKRASPKNEERTWSTYQSPVREKREVYGQGFLGLGRTEKRDLARFLKDQLDLDKALERIKVELVGQRKYDAVQLFRVFDVENKGHITRGQLEAGLKECNIFPSKNELYLLMRVLDKNGDGLIRYREFKEEIEPRDHKSVFSTEKQEEINYEVRRLFRRLLNKIISNELSCEELRRSLNKKFHFSVFEAFTNLKKSYTEFVTVTTFKDLLNDQGIFASLEDCELLLVRYDRNKNGRVSYSEFVDEMVQKVPLNEDQPKEEQPKEQQVQQEKEENIKQEKAESPKAQKEASPKVQKEASPKSQKAESPKAQKEESPKEQQPKQEKEEEIAKEEKGEQEEQA